jgi:sulfur relay (sulfurtransferase) DsrC/TusE family protein
MTNTTADPPAKSERAGECEWTPSLAECLAEVFGIDLLSESHWRVISACREERASHGRTPELSTLAARSHMSVRQLESLFPRGQTALAWILAGVIPPSIPSAASTETTPPNPHAPVVNHVAPAAAPKEHAEF